MSLASVPHRAAQVPCAEPGRFGSSLASRFTAVRSPAARITTYLELGGIRVNGPAAWDIQIHDSRFFDRLLRDGSLGLGESYVDGWWDAECLDECLLRLHRARLYRYVRSPQLIWLWVTDWLLNRQSRSRSLAVANQHYCIGNELFEAMLDATMQYTCAYWKNVSTLEQAQQNKLELIAAKLHLRPGMRVLELGGGFGQLARYLAVSHGCDVVSYNISGEQVRYARRVCRGLPVRIVEADYRDAANERPPFDRVVSIGLCEHVGHKNYRAFFDLMRDTLADGGICLLHTIGANQSCWSTDPWVDRYIFPNGMMPSIAQLGRAAERDWVIEDWHNFGPDYDRTLLAWWVNFNRAWPNLRDRYGDRFYRVWKYYLLGSAAAFRCRVLQLWQVVLTKSDVPYYVPVR